MQGRKSVTQVETQAVFDPEQNGCERTLNVSFLFGFLSFFLSFHFTFDPISIRSFFVSFFPSVLPFLSFFPFFIYFLSFLRTVPASLLSFIAAPSAFVFLGGLSIYAVFLYFFLLHDSTRKYLYFSLLLNQFSAITCIQVGFSLHSYRYAGCASASEKRR